MKPQNKKYLPDPSISKQEMKKIQLEIGEKAIFKDKVSYNLENIQDLVILGVDQGFLDEKIISSAIAMKNGEIIEKVYATSTLEMPYIPGLLAFREAPSIVKALEKLSTKPDTVLFDGSGRIHFREAGIATHIGLLFDTPSVGVAKNLLCGKPRENIQKLEEGEKVPILPDKRISASENEIIGYAYQSKQYKSTKKINPLFVSSGHKLSSKTAVEIVEKTCNNYKLPEPIRIADKYVAEVKSEIK